MAINQTTQRQARDYYFLLEDETVIALQKALHFIHPLAPEGGKGTLSNHEFWRGANEFVQAACLSVFNQHADKQYYNDEKKGRKKKRVWGAVITTQFWPPAFELRQENEDEAFARMVLAAY